MTGQLTGQPVSTFGSGPGLLTIIAFLLLWISGAFKQVVPSAAPDRPSTIRLGTPRLVAMSAAEEADAAHLLGSSVAAFMAADELTE
ncbi:MAG: hypothetical protein ABSA21_04000 [Candidatus Limnocylindrales bacterium]